MRYSEFLNYVLELMPFIRSLKVRSMFGGYGLYQEGHIFAIVIRDTLYLKSDAIAQSDFIESGLQRFTYISKERTITLQYFEAPPEVFEESDSMRDWVRKALDASIRQSSHSPSPSSSEAPN